MSRPMDEFSPVRKQIESLILAVERGEISAAEMEQLDRLLRDEPLARRLYAQYMLETVDLRRWAACSEFCEGKGLPENGSANSGKVSDASVESPATSGILGSAVHGKIGYFSQMGPISFLITMSILLVTGIVAWDWWNGRLPVARQVAQRQQEHEVKREFVGRITNMIDCKWVDPKTAPIGPVAVLLGCKYALYSGLLEITYDSGTKVILEGPVDYEVDSRNSGLLVNGKVTAKLEKNEEV